MVLIWAKSHMIELLCCFYLEASVQKFKRKDGEAANQLINAMAVAVSNLLQWFSAQSFRSLPISTVIPAEAHAAANVSVEVICNKIKAKEKYFRSSIIKYIILKKRCCFWASAFIYGL